MPVAQEVIEFISKLKITVGKDAGKPFVLRPWQQSFVHSLYHEEGNQRPVRTGILSGARKIGKSTFAAAIGMAHLIGPVAEPNGQIILAANTREQASNVFDEIVRMVRMDPNLAQLVELVPSKSRAYVKRSDMPGAGSVIRVISADAHTAHGLNPSVVIMDELGQAKNYKLFEALTTSQAAREHPLFVTISTQNGDPHHFFSEMVEDAAKGNDPSLICHLYAADEGCDLMDEAQWAKANPALGDFCSIDFYRNEAAKAARLPSAEDSFRKYLLNQKISLHTGLVRAQDWRDLSDPDCALQPGEDIILSLDMSSTKDLTALTAISCDKMTRVDSWFWKPEEQVAEATKQDRIRYDLLAKGGQLLTTPGRAIDPEYMFEKIAELHGQFNVVALVVDRWGIDGVRRRITEMALDIEIANFGQGWVSMSPAISVFERAVLNGTLRHGNHPLLNFCVLNAVTKSDHAGNRVLDKSAVRMRIDGAVTLVMALGYKDKFIEAEGEPVNPYDLDDNFSLLTL